MMALVGKLTYRCLMRLPLRTRSCGGLSPESARNARLAFATTYGAAVTAELAVVGIAQLLELLLTEPHENPIPVCQSVQYLGLGSTGGTNSDQGERGLAVFVLNEDAGLS